MRYFPASALFAILTSIGLLATGCSGGGGGSNPVAPAGPTAALQTSWGSVTVSTNGNPFNFDKADASVQRGYDKARSQIGAQADSLRLDGLQISVQDGTFDGAVGEYHPNHDVIEMAAGVENVIAHELQHRFCHQLGNSGPCCTYQDHPGGYDLSCNPI